MTPVLFLACALTAADSTATNAPSALDREAYQAARAKAGRDPDANVKLALWCEAHGLDSERLKHLSLAILADPAHAGARALMGMVSVDGRWGRPESVADRLKADQSRQALRAEYESRRSKTQGTADEQWKLARWCEQVGLAAEATAHDTAVTRLDPSRDAAWRKIGCKKFEGRWLSAEQVEAVKTGREAQNLADKHWMPTLERWRDGLDKPRRQAEAEEGLFGVTDPLAVRSIFKVFARGGARDQLRAVRLLGQVDSTDASRGLAVLGVFGGTDEVRRQAIETLRGRDVRGVLDAVIGLLRDPIKFAAKPNLGLDSPAVLFIEGEKANLERIYMPSPGNVNLRSPNVQARLPQLMEQATAQSNQRFFDDLQSLLSTNATIEVKNKNALALLKGVTGKDYGTDKLAWMSWWTDKKGYAFQAPPPVDHTAEKPTITEILSSYVRHSCFAAGTTVQTLNGPRAIEEIKVGDRLLTQDTTSGALSYQPALAVFHNPPAETLRIKVGGEDVVSTGIHRFWKAGHGWTMARELKVGDAIRQVGGTALVEGVEPAKKQPVFNLEVARGSDFFVGNSGVLVHDNSLVETVTRPFDAAPEVGAIAKAR